MSDERCADSKRAFIGPVIDETTGSRVCWTHDENHQNRSGIVRPIYEGECMDDSAVFVDGEPGSWAPYETVGDMKRSHGPIRANSRNFRVGWDQIFGNKNVGSA